MSGEESRPCITLLVFNEGIEMVKLSLRVAALLAVLSSLMVLGACGGGASSGSTGAAGNNSILNALDASSTSPDKLPEAAFGKPK